MNEEGIVKICDTLGINYGQAYSGSQTWGPHMSIACPVAIKTHGDPHDDNMSCSVQVVPDGPSGARCFSGNCSYKGSLLRLVKYAVEIRGSPPALVELLKEVESVEAITLSAQHARTGKEIQRLLAAPVRADERDTIPERLFDGFAGKVPRYAIDRGIQLSTAKAWGLGYDKEAGYLVFPVRKRDGKLVGMVGRAVSADAPRRHHNYLGLDKSKHLFGAQMLEHGKPIVIVESCIDALNTWQALDGEACTVATLGEGFSEAHVKQISAMRPPAVYIFTDGDHAGRIMGGKIAYGLHGHVTVRLMECPWGPIIDATATGLAIHKKVDPSDLPAHIVKQLFMDARVVKRQVEWTDPPPIYDAAAA